MSCIRLRLVALGLALAASAASAGEFYVAPDGDDAAAGSLDRPFASLQRAQHAASPGDTVWVRGGQYTFSGTDRDIGVLFDKSGQPGSPIRYFAYEDETPVFDFYQLRPQARIRGFSVRADHLHFRGLELRGVQQILTDVNESWGIRVENGAEHNVFERLNLHHNEGPGLFIADGGHNLVLNSDSHHNYDPDRGGENADGFGSHSNDPGNVFIGNRAWENSDDGFDFINSPGVVRLENSWAWRNGYVPDTDRRAGNGAGIKAGGFGLNLNRFPDDVPRHEIVGNVAFDNRAQGIYANHHPGGLDFLNNTAFDNARNFDLLADVGAADHLLRNNLAFGRGGTIHNATLDEINAAFNSWNLDVEVTAEDFASLDKQLALLPRNADGSLPTVEFLRLAAGSDLIDAGTNVGLDFEGEAPDLGAFEAAAP